MSSQNPNLGHYIGIGKRFVAMGRAHCGGLIAPENSHAAFQKDVEHICLSLTDAQTPWTGHKKLKEHCFFATICAQCVLIETRLLILSRCARADK